MNVLQKERQRIGADRVNRLGSLELSGREGGQGARADAETLAIVESLQPLS